MQVLDKLMYKVHVHTPSLRFSMPSVNFTKQKAENRTLFMSSFTQVKQTCTTWKPFKFSCNIQSWQCWPFVLHKFDIKLDAVISQLNFDSKYHDKCKFALNLIYLATIFNLFPLEVAKNAIVANFMYYRKTGLFVA